MKCLLIVLLSLSSALPRHVPGLQEFVNANNIFAASLYTEIVKNGHPNLLISPYSAETALIFAQSGCKGETAEELRNGLHLPDDKNKIESGVKESISILKSSELYTLHTANKLYVKEGFAINEEFKHVAIKVFGADVENTNFDKNVEAARTMNQWVEQQTHNKIKNLISSEVLDEDTRTVLINAIYFKGNWSKQFPQYATRKNKFYKARNDIKEVDTMHQRDYFNYYHSTELNAKFLELSYQGEDVSMVISLPDEVQGLNSLENQIGRVLTPQNFTRELVKVALPKFKIESVLPLVETMQKLGIKKVFNPGEADLSGIAGKKGDLVVTDVLQKTYIEVEEQGVEAAAATYVVGGARSAVREIPIPGPKEFIADHPFMFYIKAKNFIIFAGRVSNPLNN